MLENEILDIIMGFVASSEKSPGVIVVWSVS